MENCENFRNRNYFYTENSEKCKKMTNKNPPTKNSPVGGPILDLIWESPLAGGEGGLAEIPPPGGLTPSWIEFFADS